MKRVKEAAPVICEKCGKTFQTKYAFICPKCIKKASSERAKRIRLNKLGNDAYSQQKREYHEKLNGKGDA